MKRILVWSIFLVVLMVLIVATRRRQSARPFSPSSLTPAVTQSSSATTSDFSQERTPPTSLDPKQTVFAQLPTPPEAADIRWRQASTVPEMAAFQHWAADYAGSPSSQKIPEGLALAKARRAVMHDLIRRDPETALANATPEFVRRALPPEIRDQLEEKVDARANMMTYGTTGSSEAPAVIRRAELADGRQFNAFVYGHREFIATVEDLPVHGVALDGDLAVSEWPGRVAEALEADEAKAQLSADPICSESGLETSANNTEIALFTADRIDFFCGPAHALGTLKQSATKEWFPNIDPNTPPLAASDGNGLAPPLIYTRSDPAWTMGTKRLLVARVQFKSENSPPDPPYVNSTYLSVAECTQIVEKVSDAWDRYSYGRLQVQPVQSGGSRITPVVSMARTASGYCENDMDLIRMEVEYKLLSQHQIDARGYDHLIIILGKVPILRDDGHIPEAIVGWGGLANIGGRYSWIRVNGENRTSIQKVRDNATVIVHELGHNLGLRHSSNWYTFRIGYENEPLYAEYGDIYDVMGHGGLKHDYNIRHKLWLGWMDAARVPFAMGDGVHVIRAHDLGYTGGLRGLQVVPESFYNPFDGKEPLYLEFRAWEAGTGRDPDYNFGFQPVACGLQIRRGHVQVPRTWLLDATPETANGGNGDEFNPGNADSPLPPGRTFSYHRGNKTLFITNLGADPSAGEVTVDIRHGPFPGNHSPTGTITATPSKPNKNQTIHLRAHASDIDGDDLAYYWQIKADEGNPGFPREMSYPNSDTLTVMLPHIGSWTVTCRVSDRHGGENLFTLPLVTAPNNPPQITAISNKTTDEDTPITISFTISDPDDFPESLTVSGSVTDTKLFPSGSVVFSGTGANRALTLTPAANRWGTSEVAITVSDGTAETVAVFMVTVNPVTPGISLISPSATWRYRDAAGAPDPDWLQKNYRDERDWPTGGPRFVFPAPVLLQPGMTVLSPLSDRITCYFRKTFNMPGSVEGTPTLRFMCDDGLVVYLNGAEVWRHNMPNGPVAFDTRASSPVEGKGSTQWNTVVLDPQLFQMGLNTLAVEVHDVGPTKNGDVDVNFAMNLALLESPIVSNWLEHVYANEDEPVAFTFNARDSEDVKGELSIQAESSNPSLLSPVNVSISQSDWGVWKFRATPQRDAFGDTDVTLKISDGSSETWKTVRITWLPVNDAPVIFPIPNMAVSVGETVPLISVRVDDVDNPPGSLVITASSDNPALLPPQGVEVLPGPEPKLRWLRLTPAPEAEGDATITVATTDGALNASTSFIFRVSAPLDPADTEISLLPAGSIWRYWPNALPLEKGVPVDFTAPRLDDRAWPSGRAKLGYGNDGEVTAVPVTPWRITTYFRNVFTVGDPSALGQLNLRMICDDGAVVYLNGQEVWQANMPNGVPVTPNTPALTDVSGNKENAWQLKSVAPTDLVAGPNVIAVEVHQSVMPAPLQDNDMGFDLQITADPVPSDSIHTLIPPGSGWNYWDRDVYPDVNWHTPVFVDSDWSQGLARLGYGILGATTTVNADNSDGTGRNPSVLFRKIFMAGDPSVYSVLHLLTMHDDGIRVFINGIQVLSDNVRSQGGVGDYAWTEVLAPLQATWRHYLISPKSLVAGWNLIAVSVHQASPSGTDLGFDLQLTGDVSGVPILHITQGNNGMELSWPDAFADWRLQRSSDLQSWSPVVTPPTNMDGQLIILEPTPLSTQMFYRLERP